MHSSYSLHWLSKVPEEIKNKSSLAYNKDKIYWVGDKELVNRAYVAQFEKDMMSFLEARAKELVEGGLMLIQTFIDTTGDKVSPQTRFDFTMELLGESLFDMAKMGLTTEEQVQSFNLPWYVPSIDLLKGMVEKSKCFTIERTDLFHNPLEHLPIDSVMFSLMFRSALEGLIQQHFGSKIMDRLFDTFQQKVEKNNLNFDAYKANNNLFALLKRKVI